MGLITKLFRRPEVPAPAGPDDLAKDRRAQRRQGASGSATVSWIDASSELRTETAEVENVSPEGMALRVPEFIAVGDTVRVRSEELDTRASVRHCRKREKDCLAGLRFIERERRRTERLRGSGQVNLDWTASSGERKATPARVRNISDTGMQVEVPAALDADQFKLDEMVRVRGTSYECQGWIRHRVANAAGYLLGIEFLNQPYLQDSLEYGD
jgi:hypothetical protein